MTHSTLVDSVEQLDIFEINSTNSKADERNNLPALLTLSANKVQNYSNSTIILNSTQSINPNKASSLNSQFVNLETN